MDSFGAYVIAPKIAKSIYPNSTHLTKLVSELLEVSIDSVTNEKAIVYCSAEDENPPSHLNLL
jgi:hypothetical protein